MADVRTNIFGIGEVYELQRDGLWVEKNRESFREYGYFGGGGSYGLPTLSKVERTDYSNDTTTASIRGSLTTTFASGSATFGNSFFGYITHSGVVDRIDYSNETTSRRGSTQSSAESTGTGNNNYGYHNTNNPIGNTNCFRVDYSNDLTNSLFKGTFVNQITQRGATGNSNFGWFGGGSVNSSGECSFIDRINYSNDTNTALRRGFINGNRRWVCATGNSNFGYFGGGVSFATRIDRITYSNDTVTASIRSFLQEGRHAGGMTGNSNFGYYGGGSTGTSRVERIDYANDTSLLSSE